MIRQAKDKLVIIEPPCSWDYVGRVAATGRSLMSVPVTNQSGAAPLVGEIAYIGTQQRQWDVGFTRVRGYQSNQVLVAENEIEWESGQWIWCPRTFAPMAKIQRVSGSGDRPTVWMDYDLGPQPLPPKVNVFGSFFAKVGTPQTFIISAVPIEANSSIPGGPVVQLRPDGSFTLNGWMLTVSFPTPGYKIIEVKVTDSNNAVGRRIIPVACDLVPTSGAMLESLTWQMSRGFEALISASSFSGRPLVPVFLKYGEFELLLWAITGERSDEPDAVRKSIAAYSALRMLDSLISHSMLFEDGSRDSWYKVPGLNATRAIYTLLQFHSTVTELVNIDFSQGRCALPIRSQQFHEASLLAQINELLGNCLSAGFEWGTYLVFTEEPMLLADRSGILVRGVDAMNFLRGTSGALLGMLQAGGFAYETPYLARWPGTTPEIWSQTQDRKGYVVSSQADMNQVAGMLASYLATPDATFQAVPDLDELPKPWYLWAVDGERVQPTRMSTRFQDGVDAVTDVTGKTEVEPQTGETIVIPTEPEVPPIEYPPPPPVEPPPSYSGWAFVRAQHYIVRTSNIYSTSPIWEIAVWSGNYGNPANPPRIIDFRYIETGGGVSIVANLSNGILIRCDNPTASTPDWYILATPDRYMSMPERPFVISSLVTLPQDPQYIGMFYCYTLTVQYTGHDCFAFTNDGGATWTERIFRSNLLYPGVGWASCETAGTNQITAVGRRSGDYSLGAYRTENKGDSWAYLSDADSITGHLEGVWIARIRKPWQLGASGTLYYVTGVKIYGVQQVPVIAGKSTNNLDTVVETFPSGYTRLGAGLEYWTYDMNEVHVIARVQGQDKWVHAVTFNGGGNWTLTGTFSEPPPMFSVVSLRGNPANNKEWTFVVYWTTLPPPPNPPRPIIYQTLDGGYTFTNLSGNWYDLANRGVTHAQDFLILPPFSVKSRRDP